jgi:hypothetical protein
MFFISVCVVLCHVAALQLADLSKESYHLGKHDYETVEDAKAQQRAVEPVMNE